MRNPIKYLHPFHLFWLVLAGFGLEALYRGYLQARTERAGDRSAANAPTEGKLSGFEKGWLAGLILTASAIGLALVENGWLMVVEFESLLLAAP